MNPHLELQHFWMETRAGIPTQAITEQDISLSDDFRQYLRLSSPVGETMDNELVEWWSFERIRNIPDQYPHELGPQITNDGRQYLFFADYCIWCWGWAISCASDQTRGKVALVAGTTYDKFVADSFTDFVQRYVSNPKAVIGL